MVSLSAESYDKDEDFDFLSAALDGETDLRAVGVSFVVKVSNESPDAIWDNLRAPRIRIGPEPTIGQGGARKSVINLTITAHAGRPRTWNL
jgi:hypothetical protein